MPSLVEEDPEYPEKVKAYLDKHGLKELPWGFIVAHGHLVAVSTYRERLARSLGEVLVVADAVDGPNVSQVAASVKTVAGQDAGHGAAAAGVKPTNAG